MIREREDAGSGEVPRTSTTRHRMLRMRRQVCASAPASLSGRNVMICSRTWSGRSSGEMHAAIFPARSCWRARRGKKRTLWWGWGKKETRISGTPNERRRHKNSRKEATIHNTGQRVSSRKRPLSAPRASCCQQLQTHAPTLQTAPTPRAAPATNHDKMESEHKGAP